MKRYCFLLFSVIFFSLACLADDSARLIKFSKSKNVWQQPPVLPPLPVPVPIPDPDVLVELRPYAYIKWEMYYDTRQVLGLREDCILFFPAPYLPDIFKQDINAHGFWNMDAFESRIGLSLQGPQWGCVTTDAIVEGDFRGAFEASIFNFRLRNAVGRVVWPDGYFLFGQWWHPLWIEECFPHMLGFGIGTPLDFTSRSPQLRFVQRWDWFEFFGVLSSQSDFDSNGPIEAVPTYIQNAVIPNLTAQMRAYVGNHLFGVAGDYKRLVPRIVSNNNVKVNERIDSFAFEGFATINVAHWALRLKALWAQNANDHLLISGFGVKSIEPVTDCRTYANTACAGAWLDFSYYFHCNKLELGVFAGGTKNLGSRERLYIDKETGAPIIYWLVDMTQNVDYVVEVVPRFVYMDDPFRAGVEFQYTRASWGTPNACGRVTNGIPVDDYRILFVLYYLF